MQSAAEPLLAAGCEQRADGTIIVRVDAPSYETLAAATQHNKKGRKGSTLPSSFTIARARGAQGSQKDEATIAPADLWAALRAQGGLHLVRACPATSLASMIFLGACSASPAPTACMACPLSSGSSACMIAWTPGQMAHVCTPAHAVLQVRKRGMLLAVVQGMVGQSAFPPALAKALDARIDTWLLPMYGFTMEEELGVLPPGKLKGESCSGIEVGYLGMHACRHSCRLGGRAGHAAGGQENHRTSMYL